MRHIFSYATRRLNIVCLKKNDTIVSHQPIWKSTCGDTTFRSILQENLLERVFKLENYGSQQQLIYAIIAFSQRNEKCLIKNIEF